MAKLIVENATVDGFEFVNQQPDKTKPMTYILKGIYAQSEQKNGNGRRYPYNELKSEIDRFDREMIQTGRALGELEHPECNLTPNFEVLTESGFKWFNQLKVGDLVWTRNNDTKKAELKPIKKIVNQNYKGDGYIVSGKNFYGEFTSNHRFITIDRNGKTEVATIEEIYNNRGKFSHNGIPKTLDIDDVNESAQFNVPKVQSFADKSHYSRFNHKDFENDLIIDKTIFCKLFGFWLAEGSSKLKYNEDNLLVGGEISVKQSLKKNKDICCLIDKLFEELPDELQHRITTNIDKTNNYKYWCISDLRLAKYFHDCGNIYTKKIPNEIKMFGKQYLKELVYYFGLGDGRKNVRHFRKYNNLLLDNIADVFSTSEQLVDDLSYLTLKCGISTAKRCQISKEDYIFCNHLIKAENKKPLYIASMLTSPAVALDKRTLKIKKIDVQEFDNYGAYCIQVDNMSFFQRVNDKSYWTGNCPEIRPQESAIRILSMKEDNKCWIGESCILASQPEFGIRGTPKGDILLSLVQYGTKVGFSTRAVGEVDDDGVVSNMKLCTIDCVANPSIGQFCESNGERFVNGILESKNFVITQHGDILEAKYDTFENKLAHMPNTFILSKKAEHVGNAFHEFLESLVE